MIDDKSSGIDFDRHVFVQSQPTAARPATPLVGILFVVAIIAVIVFAAIKLFPQFGTSSDSGAPSDQALASIDQRLSGIEQRLERLETTRRVVASSAAEKPSSKQTPASSPSPRTIYRISPTPALPVRSAPSKATDDPAVAQRLSSIQRGLGALQSDETENHDAWQATTSRLADVAGQVGSQGVQILRSQDELKELLSRTELESIPFELKRGSDPVQVGPVSFVLKSVDSKQQRYTLCIYLEPSCVALRNRVLYEVAQFVPARNSRPLEVVATKITKDGLVGYLEIPKVSPADK